MDPASTEPGRILEAVGFANARVLEIGAADGRLTFRYARAARLVVGIDTKHPETLTASRNCPLDLRARIRLARASATALPFPAAVFDIAIFASSL